VNFHGQGKHGNECLQKKQERLWEGLRGEGKSARASPGTRSILQSGTIGRQKNAQGKDAKRKKSRGASDSRERSCERESERKKRNRPRETMIGRDEGFKRFSGNGELRKNTRVGLPGKTKGGGTPDRSLFNAKETKIGTPQKREKILIFSQNLIQFLHRLGGNAVKKSEN